MECSLTVFSKSFIWNVWRWKLFLRQVERISTCRVTHVMMCGWQVESHSGKWQGEVASYTRVTSQHPLLFESVDASLSFTGLQLWWCHFVLGWSALVHFLLQFCIKKCPYIIPNLLNTSFPALRGELASKLSSNLTSFIHCKTLSNSCQKRFVPSSTEARPRTEIIVS